MDDVLREGDQHHSKYARDDVGDDATAPDRRARGHSRPAVVCSSRAIALSPGTTGSILEITGGSHPAARTSRSVATSLRPRRGTPPLHLFEFSHAKPLRPVSSSLISSNTARLRGTGTPARSAATISPPSCGPRFRLPLANGDVDPDSPVARLRAIQASTARITVNDAAPDELGGPLAEAHRARVEP